MMSPEMEAWRDLVAVTALHNSRRTFERLGFSSEQIDQMEPHMRARIDECLRAEIERRQLG